MKRYGLMLRCFYILCLVVSLMACQRVDSGRYDCSDVITFGTLSETKSRAATLVGSSDEATFRSEPFSVYGDWINSNGERHEVFHDVKVSYTTDDDTPTGWIYDPIQYWQVVGEYEFRAYWPASAVVLGTATARTLALEYNMLQRNDDMMVAYKHCPTKNNGQPVDLSFHHTLAAVAVKFQAPNAECEYRLKNMFFTSLNYIGALPYDLTGTSQDVTNYWVYADGSRSFVDEDNIMNSERLREWSSADGRLIPASADDYPEEFDMFLPQALAVGEGVAQPSITFTVDVKWATVDTVTMTVALPTVNGAGEPMIWRAGKKYVYVITVQPDKFDIEVRTTEWDDVDATVGDIVL
ncbi:MAG: fimbrillin family protein [Alistipes sp.]|nr:fimbrillin family protein [Alistipes sp.]